MLLTVCIVCERHVEVVITANGLSECCVCIAEIFITDALTYKQRFIVAAAESEANLLDGS